METNEAAYEKMKAGGVSYQTGVPAALTAGLFAEGLITRRGASPAEAIDPKLFVERLPGYGLHMIIILPPLPDPLPPGERGNSRTVEG